MVVVAKSPTALVILVWLVEEIYFWRLFTDWIAGFFFQLQTQSSSRIASEKAKKYGEHLLDSLDSDGQDREYD